MILRSFFIHEKNTQSKDEMTASGKNQAVQKCYWQIKEESEIIWAWEWNKYKF